MEGQAYNYLQEGMLEQSAKAKRWRSTLSLEEGAHERLAYGEAEWQVCEYKVHASCARGCVQCNACCCCGPVDVGTAPLEAVWGAPCIHTCAEASIDLGSHSKPTAGSYSWYLICQ